MGRSRLVCLTVAFALTGCGDDGGGLSDYYPDLPKETGEPQAVFAGEVTEAAQLVTGPAQSGLVGDFFIKNDRVTFIIQAPTRVIGVIPQGGNVVDAVLTDGTKQIVEDHFGELGLIYLLGRTCDPDRIEIVRDGSKGGVAVIRAIGKAATDDFLNLKGIGVLPVDPTVDPDIDDGVLCATTYVLAPGSTSLAIHHSLFNDGPDNVAGPMGTLADTGGFTEGWTNASGFQRADISALTSLSRPQPIDYVLYQGPGVAYGIVPRHAVPVEHAQAVVAGVSIFLDGNSSILDILQKDKYFLHMNKGKGVLQSYDFVVGKDGADVDEVYRTGNGEELRPVSGRVDLSGGGAALGARVGVFLDGNGNGQLDPIDVDADGNGQPDDKILSYMDVAVDGTFSGNLPTTAGNLLLRAEVKNVGRSPAQPIAATMSFVVPSPIKVDFQILDQDTTMPIPGRLLVIGDHPAFPDQRVFETYDRRDGLVTQAHAIRGTTVDVGDGVDPPLYLPANGNYRVYASRGTEWSVASLPVTGAANANLTLTLKHVVPTPGYLASDWHIHQIGSPDSNVMSDERIRSAVSSGTEMFAVTDHDYVSDLQPLVEQMHLQQYLRVLPGIEVTPFAYGHFNSWPIAPDNDSASHGAIDWGRGREGYAMTPGEIFQAMRDRGGKMVQVNHPRGSGFTEFQAAWNRANVKYDYTSRMIFGDYERASVPNDYLRLPGESLWSDQFNGLEIWNGFAISDSNLDGLREIKSLDRVMRDWLSMLSLGLFVTPAGNSDTHTSVTDPVGMPRTYVRVGDDSSSALVNGTAVDAVLQTQLGANNTPRDVVVTNGPMLDIKVGSVNAIGRVFPSPGGAPITLTVTMTSPDWAEFDTLEVFANTTPDAAPKQEGDTTLVPLQCWTTRTIANLAMNDPCKRAAMPAQAMTVQLANIPGPGSYKRYEAQVSVTLDAQDIVTRAGATGTDAWLVFRVRGDRATFPIMLNDALADAASRAAALGGDFTTIRTALTGKGVPATAVASPVFIDFDGGGYRAPFAP
ncbi:MAG: PHP domain-containing protein [Myxococcales bacterium]|nr:PHP domain-containing protein [Myxococcales bacterium]